VTELNAGFCTGSGVRCGRPESRSKWYSGVVETRVEEGGGIEIVLLFLLRRVCHGDHGE
jgi:hypothetical protein